MIADEMYSITDIENATGAQLSSPEPETTTITIPWVFSCRGEWTAEWSCSEGPLEAFKGNLAETHTLLVSNDDWRPGAVVPRYVVRELVLPSWLVQGWTAKYLYQDEAPDVEQAYEAAVKQACVTLADPGDSPLMRALRWLCEAKDGKFVRSLREQWADMGRLSPRQIEACRDYRPGRGRG